MRIGNRLLAIGWLCFMLGSIIATKGFEPSEYDPFVWYEKLQVFFTVSVTMLLGYSAGKETYDKRNKA